MRLGYWIAIGVLSTASALLLMSGSREPAAPLPPELSRIFEAQRSLPAESVTVVQDLRLFGAVQLAYFTSTGRYGRAEELISEGYLDPQWPRADPRIYSLSCSEEQERLGFVCYADALTPERDSFRVDATQVVRFERGRRPEESSPMLGSVEETP